MAKMASAESQDDMAYSQDDMILSTVEEESEESQMFTLGTATEEEQCEADDGNAARSNGDGEQAHFDGEETEEERRQCDFDAGDGYEGDQQAHQYHDGDAVDETQSNANDGRLEDEYQYAQEEGHAGGDEEHMIQHPAERYNQEEDDQDATNYVGQCLAHLEHLRKRKREQEEHVENLVEATFGQIDTLVNTLMGAIQECHAASHNRFEIADAKLAQNLHFHNRVEKKLRMIASILLEEGAEAQEE